MSPVHYHAYKTGKVLHRDLSENNLMLRRLKNGKIVGVLNDWDMSSRVDDTGSILPTITNHLIGTLPFMARQLLLTHAPKHMYRHDLESFFYILVWAAILYNFKTKTRGPMSETSMLKAWSQSSDDLSLVRHSMAKLDFLEDPDVYEAIFEEIQPEFQELHTRWIKPLHALFIEAAQFMKKQRLARNKVYDRETCGGILTFERFMAAIGESPRLFDTLLDDAGED